MAVIVSQCHHSPVCFYWTAWDPDSCATAVAALSLAQALGRQVIDVFSDSKLFVSRMTSLCVLLEQILDTALTAAEPRFFCKAMESLIG